MICRFRSAGLDIRFRKCLQFRLFIWVPPFLIYSKSAGLFGHKKSENNNRTIQAVVFANQLRTGVILAEDTIYPYK